MVDSQGRHWLASQTQAEWHYGTLSWYVNKLSMASIYLFTHVCSPSFRQDNECDCESVCECANAFKLPHTELD